MSKRKATKATQGKPKEPPTELVSAGGEGTHERARALRGQEVPDTAVTASEEE